MPQVELDNSHILDIPFEKPTDIKSFFIFGLHKCGSTLMNQIFIDICSQLEIPCIAIPYLAFKQGIPGGVWGKCEKLNSLIIDGYCYRGFRNYPVFLRENKLITKRKKILLVRDPRDAIVSAYFSFANSHRQPGKGKALTQFLERREQLKTLDIEAYVLEQSNQVKRDFNHYNEYLTTNSLLKVYRYEDIIFDKESWIKDMLKFLNLSLNNTQISRIAEKHNIVPQAEDVSQHVRKVKPGDHKEKLSSECIAKLNDILGEVLERYDYAY